MISDYTFEKDALFAQINLKGDELDMYYRVHEALAEKIPVPDLIVYLQADTDVLMQRIAMRDRPYERNMQREYIDELNRSYDRFFGDGIQRRSPVLTIQTNELDYVRRIEDLNWIADRIRQALRTVPFQPELPL
ncbi:MAG: deoxynucleoside kinase [Anaerolineales bacterium]